jgi:uncharacterized Zn-finger protein
MTKVHSSLCLHDMGAPCTCHVAKNRRPPSYLCYERVGEVVCPYCATSHQGDMVPSDILDRDDMVCRGCSRPFLVRVEMMPVSRTTTFEERRLKKSWYKQYRAICDEYVAGGMDLSEAQQIARKETPIYSDADIDAAIEKATEHA